MLRVPHGQGGLEPPPLGNSGGNHSWNASVRGESLSVRKGGGCRGSHRLIWRACRSGAGVAVSWHQFRPPRVIQGQSNFCNSGHPKSIQISVQETTTKCTKEGTKGDEGRAR